MKMKFSFGILALLVVSAFAAELKPRPIDYEQYRTYVYEYVGNVLTGIPFSSSLYSGTQLKSNVGISHIQHNRNNLYTLKLSNVTFSSLIDEVTEPVKANFARREALSEKAKEVLELPFQYAIDNATQRLQWVEVHEADQPWSLNIKKAIVEMFLVDIAGKQLKLNSEYEYSLTRRSNDEVHHGFEVYEPTSKGECQTMYQVINALPEFVEGPEGIEQFFFKVMKTRNYQNCTSSPKLTQHNWERKGCAEYCQQALIHGQSQMHNHYSAERSQCNCDEIEAEPLDQQATTTYYIECRENPYILYAENNGKVVFDNHGTKFVSFTNQTLTFQRVHGGYIDALNSKQAVRVSNLTFSLYPYAGSIAEVLTHEIPAYNLLVPRVSQQALYDATTELLDQVAEVVVGKSEDQRNVAGLMTRIIQNLAHLDSEYIMRIYREYAMVPVEKLYSNTIESVRRQLFLDAITHVGTTNVSQWLEQVLESESEGLYPMEARQVIETLPLNVYAPTKSLINLLEKKMKSLYEAEDWDKLSAYVVAYGKLIAKACPNTGVVSEDDNEIHFIPIRSRSSDWLIPDDEKCTREQTVKYIENLVKMLEKNVYIRGKLLIAQALAHTGKTLALEALAPYAKGEFLCVADDSDCIFFRTSVIYSLHHLTAVEPKRVRSIVLPIFNTQAESYELRLAAFTVLMSAGPKRYELDSVRVSLRNETSLQVISMVRSILEETANLTQACNKPLAQAAREIVATLPKVNIDGLYSQASYNEWYSTDKSTGFFANGQFVANNITAVPRHGYLNIGSHWKSLSNPWFTVAFQQKGLETAFYNLLRKSASYGPRDPATIEQLWEDLKVVSRNEDNFMLKLFVRVYEQTSLYTLDKFSVNVLYNQFMDLYDMFNSAASRNEVNFNWVRFYMPSTYTDVVPSAIGLPTIATKQNRQIVSLRLDRAEFEESQDENVQTYTFKATPQVYTSSYLALSVFNQGIKTPFNYGVYTLKNFTFYAPLHLNFVWNKAEQTYSYAVKPVFNKINFQQSNNNYAFIAESYIGTVVKAITRDITSLVPTYHHPLMQFKSRALGMNLNLGLSTERPWFLDLTSIPCDGTVAWLLEKYNEMNQFNNNMNLTLVQNEDFPAVGIAGSFNYGQFLGGKYETIESDMERNVDSDSSAQLIGEELRKLYPSKFADAAYFSRYMRVNFSTIGQEIPTSFATELTMVKAIDHHAYWFRVNSSIEQINERIWTQTPRQFIADGKLERPTIPSDLKWFLRNPEKLVGNYVAKISWYDEVQSELEAVEPKIVITGKLRRSVQDPVIPEMERQSWFHKQCEKDIKNGNATNYACELLAAHQAYFNRVEGEIQFKNVEEPVRKALRIVYAELKRSLISYWRPWSTVSTQELEAKPDFITFEARYSNILHKRPVLTLIVQTPTEKVNFTRFIVPVETFPTLIPMGYLKASPLPKDQTCVVMKDSIRTFDNVTYKTWIDECEFVVAMDCNEESKQFAVTVKGKAGKRSVRVYTPLKTYLKIRDVKKDQASLTIHGANDEQIGEDFIVKTGTPVLHVSANGIQKAHQIFMHDSTVNVILPSEKVRVAFDGFYLKVTTSPLYIGKTCGLCGNQNQEFTYEFVDPELRDLESNLTAFRDSYALHDCTDPNPCHDDVCEVETPVHYGRRNSIAAPKKNLKVNPLRFEYKTIIEERNGQTCFTKFPQIMCKDSEPVEETTVSRIVEWVCFSQSHPLHAEWVKLAKKRVITELVSMPTSATAAYEEPQECVSARGI